MSRSGRFDRNRQSGQNPVGAAFGRGQLTGIRQFGGFDLQLITRNAVTPSEWRCHRRDDASLRRIGRRI